MSFIRGVMLEIADGDPQRLLESDLGGRHPLAYQSEARRTMGHWKPLMSSANMERKSLAIVLAWDGKKVDSGCDHAFRVLRPRYRSGCHDIGDRIEGVLQLGAWLAKVSQLRLILIDASGREVTSE